jgi:hypothetical protein
MDYHRKRMLVITLAHCPMLQIINVGNGSIGVLFRRILLEYQLKWLLFVWIFQLGQLLKMNDFILHVVSGLIVIAIGAIVLAILVATNVITVQEAFGW